MKIFYLIADLLRKQKCRGQNLQKSRVRIGKRKTYAVGLVLFCVVVGINILINIYYPSAVIVSSVLTSTFLIIITTYSGYINYNYRLKKDTRLRYLTEAFLQLSSFCDRKPAIMFEEWVKGLKKEKLNSELRSNIDHEGNLKTQAYNLIAREYNKHLAEAEKAISTIHLYGTSEEIKLALEFVNCFAGEKTRGKLYNILQKLRDELRKELDFEMIEEEIKNLRLLKSSPRQE